MKADELREMSDDQLQLLLKETQNNLFRLRIQAQMERLDAPSELRRHRRLIARIHTVTAERARQRAAESSGSAESQSQPTTQQQPVTAS